MTEPRYLRKDDSDLFDMIERGRELRRKMGIAESTEEFDAREAGKKWHEMRKTQVTQRELYHIIIEPYGDFYRASPLILPEVVAQGETPHAAKENVAQVLRAYLKKLLNQGQSLPIDHMSIAMVEVSFA